MNNTTMSLMAVAGLALAAHAGTSRLEIQVSKDGGIWSNAVTVNQNAGDSGRVLVRYAISWVPGINDTGVPAGFASMTFQPIFANVRTGDVIAPFAASGNNINGGGINLDATPLNGPFGRPRPFASTGPAATNPSSMGNRYIVHSHSSGSGGAPAGNFYRIARNDITRWMGTGPTSGVAANNNFNGSGGIAVVQKGSGNVGSNDPVFNVSIQNVVLFQIAINVAPVGVEEHHTITLDVPIAGFGGRNRNTGLREASWFTGPTDSFGNYKGVIFVHQAQINIVPTPGALGLLALGGMLGSRRRRYGVISRQQRSMNAE